MATSRLTLRQWRGDDLAPFAVMNADTDVMRYYPAPWTREQSDASAERVRQLIEPGRTPCPISSSINSICREKGVRPA
ncbi:GNAT family N-acetyltransferase [Nitrospirales bacterium NOB]|nr:GNAT family N-acetyltransferase [Nitrospirales bacterium NOB]